VGGGGTAGGTGIAEGTRWVREEEEEGSDKKEGGEKSGGRVWTGRSWRCEVGRCGVGEKETEARGCGGVVIRGW